MGACQGFTSPSYQRKANCGFLINLSKIWGRQGLTDLKYYQISNRRTGTKYFIAADNLGGLWVLFLICWMIGQHMCGGWEGVVEVGRGSVSFSMVTLASLKEQHLSGGAPNEKMKQCLHNQEWPTKVTMSEWLRDSSEKLTWSTAWEDSIRQ